MSIWSTATRVEAFQGVHFKWFLYNKAYTYTNIKPTFVFQNARAVINKFSTQYNKQKTFQRPLLDKQLTELKA